MKKIVLIFSLFLGLAINAQTTWIVNNNPNQYADFTTLQEAVDGASNGDVLMIQPSPDSYGNADINKQLTIVGRGYYLDANPEVVGSQWESVVGSITFINGSEGSLITGLRGSNMFIQVSDIRVSQSRLSTFNISGGTDVESLISNIELERSFLSTVSVSGYVDLVLIHNSFLGSIDSGADAYNVFAYNNVISNGNYGSHVAYSNNIFYNSGIDIDGTNNNSYNNNICDDDAPNVGGNIGNVEMSTVFVGYPSSNGYSNDDRWQLIDDPSNPAIGAGENGEDCGMFGGNTPYILSGIPEHPEVYGIYVPAVNNGNSQMNVEVKVRTNN